MEIFVQKDIKKLFHNKFVVIIGDSVQRSIYKDILVLHAEDRLISDKELRAKGEQSFLGDTLVERSELTNGTNYKEVREYKTDTFLIRFYFITRIYNEYVETILKDFQEDQPIPDVILINSCLWDITRYGKKAVQVYQENLEKFCSKLDQLVPVETCIIWRTTLPVSQSARGGFLVMDVVDKSTTLTVDVFLANYLAHSVVTNHKYDVLDMHFMFSQQQWRRARDGIHWNQYAHRRMTNIVLAHISRAWGLGIPYHSFLKEIVNHNNTEYINLNTTEVLNHAYGPYALRPFTKEEKRYGGPIGYRSNEFDVYKECYGLPPNTNLPDRNKRKINHFQMHHKPLLPLPRQTNYNDKPSMSTRIVLNPPRTLPLRMPLQNARQTAFYSSHAGVRNKFIARRARNRRGVPYSYRR